jgi:hypothetical protein
MEKFMRTVYLPALEKRVTLRAYIAAVKLEKANPDREFSTGLTTWWPTTGAEIMQQFYEGVQQRINARIPYLQRA